MLFENGARGSKLSVNIVISKREKQHLKTIKKHKISNYTERDREAFSYQSQDVACGQTLSFGLLV